MSSAMSSAISQKPSNCTSVFITASILTIYPHAALCVFKAEQADCIVVDDNLSGVANSADSDQTAP